MFERPDTGERAVLVHLDFTSEKEREDPDEFRELVKSAGVEAVDIVPTLLDAAALQIPTHLQGQSLLPILQGKSLTHRTTALCESTGWKNLRTDRYRYLLNADGSEGLWGIENDIGEYHNLANDHNYADTLASLRQMMLQHLLQRERPKKRAFPY